MPAVPSVRTTALWREAQAVCFDVDSTVSPDEGIDVLAAHARVGDRVVALTRRAMEGGMTFQDALAARLDLIAPTAGMIADCLAAHPPRLNPGIRELVHELISRGKQVYLISGGFEEFIRPLAKALGLADDHVIANRFIPAPPSTAAGRLTFDPERPTARSGGKGVALGQLKRAHGYAPLVMIGDGATDLEAKPPADLFIGYGGIAVREKVQAGADWFVTDFEPLRRAL